MVDSLADHRTWFARFVLASAGVPPSDSRLVTAFERVPRERFLGPGPWKVLTRVGYVETPSDNPAFVYQDIVIALKSESQLNNGQPTLHAGCLAILQVKPGETVVHVGAGTGYYTAVLSCLTGLEGQVVAYEIDRDLATRAADNLREYANVTVVAGSGIDDSIPPCDVIYVNAGASEPAECWMSALRPGGRLLFPLTPGQGAGFMLLVTREETDAFSARFVAGAIFTPCIGGQRDEAGKGLAEAFGRGGVQHVRSLRFGTVTDESCWFAGPNWWLSTANTRSK